MNPASNQALRIAIVHETTGVIKQLQADNERLQNELANAKANLRNRYLRSVLNLIDKQRDLGFISVDVIDDRLVLNGEGPSGWEDPRTQEMLDGLIVMPVAEKLKAIPALCELGYFVREFKPTLWFPTPHSYHPTTCPFAVEWNTTEERLCHVYSGFFSRGGILHRPTNIDLAGTFESGNESYCEVCDTVLPNVVWFRTPHSYHPTTSAGAPRNLYSACRECVLEHTITGDKVA